MKITGVKYNLSVALGIIPFCAMAQATVTAKDTVKPAPVAVVTLPPVVVDTNVRVYAPASVQNAEQAVNQYQRNVHGTSPGFRVQIEFGQERNAVNKTKADFAVKYPNVPAYISYKQPYFRVSVGDFRTRLEAICFLTKVKADYPAAFLVADNIVPPPVQ